MTLFFTMVVVMIGFGIVIPIMPFYVGSVRGRRHWVGGDDGRCLASCSSCSPPCGVAYPIATGGRSILLLGALGNAVSIYLMGLALNPGMLFFRAPRGGLLSSATIPTAMAYIGDIDLREGRRGGMGLIGAAMGMGMVIGPGIGGWLGGDSLTTPFFLACGLLAGCGGA